MDGENNGKPYEQMDDLGVFTSIFGHVAVAFFGRNFTSMAVEFRKNQWSNDRLEDEKFQPPKLSKTSQKTRAKDDKSSGQIIIFHQPGKT